jgi:hypothetical protein
VAHAAEAYHRVLWKRTWFKQCRLYGVVYAVEVVPDARLSEICDNHVATRDSCHYPCLFGIVKSRFGKVSAFGE